VNTPILPTTPTLQERAAALKLYGLLAHWEEIHDQSWLPQLIEWEEQERTRRSLERRIKSAKVGRSNHWQTLSGGGRNSVIRNGYSSG